MSILTLKFELKKGKHIYSFDPAGFDKEEPFPVFGIDNVIIGVNEVLADALEGNAYLVCRCGDYIKKERKFDAEESYKKYQKSRNSADFGWDCVATCKHISLIKRYFARPLVNKFLETIVKQKSNPLEAYTEFLESREFDFFPGLSRLISAEYLKEKGY